MAELGTVYVDVKGDFDQFGKETSSKMGGFATKAAGIFAAAFAAKKIFDFGTAAVNEAVSLNESANAVAQTFTGTALPAVQALGDKAAESFGLSTAEFNTMAVQFAGFAEKIDSTDVGGVIEDVGTRVADFASVMNLDVNEAASEFQSIMAGSSEVARKYGLDVSAAAVEQFALENGLAASKAEITEAHKIQARYGILMQQTEKWAGDFAETSDELANNTRIAQAEFANAKAELGQALLPVLTQVVSMARDHLIPLVTTLSPVFALLGDAIAQLAPFVIELVASLVPLVAKIMPPLVKILTIAFDIFMKLAEPIIQLIDVALTPIIEIVMLLVDDLAGALVPALIAFADAVVALTPLILLLTDLLRPVFDIVGMLAKLIGAALGGAIRAIVDIITSWTRKLTPLIRFLTELFGHIKSALNGVLPGLLRWFREMPGKILGVVQNAGEWLIDTGRDLISGLLEGIKDVAGNIWKWIKDNILGGIVDGVKNFFGIGSPSKVMMGIGRDITLGMAMGIEQRSGLVSRAVNGLMSVPTGSFGLGMPSLAGVGAAEGGDTITINTVNAGSRLAREVGEELAWQRRTAGI